MDDPTLSVLRGLEIDGMQLLGLLGRGGMGEVYEAFDPRLGRKVAIKLLGRGGRVDDELAARFAREARVGAALRHPNVAEIYSAGVHEGRPYYVMERVEGESLAELLSRDQRLSGRACLRVLRQAAEGLRAAHRAGIVHRDIKPANLMLDSQQRLKIVDFGLARRPGVDTTLTASRMVVGTPSYASPEQGLGIEVDHLSDIYSLGASFYHLLVGAAPFEAETPVALLMQHAATPLTPLRERNPRIPSAIAAVIERMLEKRPQDRYQSYDELIADLELLESGKSDQLSFDTSARLRRSSLWPTLIGLWRRPLVSGAIAVALFVALLAALLVRAPSGVVEEVPPAASPRNVVESPPNAPPPVAPRGEDPRSLLQNPVLYAVRLKAMAEMKQLLIQLRVAEAESGRVPSLEELRRRGLGDRLTDPWGGDLHLEEGAGDDLVLRSPGPDGRLGNGDDVVVEDRPLTLPTFDR